MEAKKMKPVRSALGRGLSALISTPVSAMAKPGSALASNEPTQQLEQFEAKQSHPSFETVSTEKGVQYLSIGAVINNPLQPRREFKEEDLADLTNSIKTQGILQPILVRPSKGNADQFEIVAGERRWRAAKNADLLQVPVIIRDLNDQDTLEISIIENIQRQDLSPIEEARAYERLAAEFKLGHQEIADRVGKNRASITNYLRLLKLPSDVIEMMRSGEISMGHAKAILTIKEPNAQLSLARKSVKESLSVRQLEAIVSRVVVLDAGHRLPVSESNRELPELPATSNHFPEVMDRMRNTLGTKVNLRHHASGKGKIEIEYFSEQELDRLVEVICS